MTLQPERKRVLDWNRLPRSLFLRLQFPVGGFLIIFPLDKEEVTLVSIPWLFIIIGNTRCCAVYSHILVSHVSRMCTTTVFYLSCWCPCEGEVLENQQLHFDSDCTSSAGVYRLNFSVNGILQRALQWQLFWSHNFLLLFGNEYGDDPRLGIDSQTCDKFATYVKLPVNKIIRFL